MAFAGSGAGFYQPKFTLDGSLFGVGRNYSTLALLYSADFRADVPGLSNS